MGYRVTEDHVRMRTTFRHEWVWELVTGDGHVAAASRPYSDRDSCEADALMQGLKVVGGRKAPRGRSNQRAAGLRVYDTGCGVWKWEYVAHDGRVVAASPVAYLTKEECERAAEAQPAAQASEGVL